MSPGGDGEQPPSNVLPFKGRQDLASRALREREMVALKMSGMTYQQIADHVGYGVTRVHDIVVQALTLTPVERAEAKALEIARYDRQLASVWPAVLTGDLGANKIALDISRERRRLLGMDEPTRVEITPVASDVQEMVQAILSLTGEPQDIVDADVIEEDVLDGDPLPVEMLGDSPLDDEFTWD